MKQDSSEYDESYRLYQQARSLFREADYVSAAALFSQSANLNPHFKTLELLGECYLRSGDPVSSIVPLAAATTLNRQARAPILLVEAFIQLRRFSDAREMLQTAQDRNASSTTLNQLAKRIDDEECALP